MLGSLAGTSTLLLGSPFPPPTAGHVRRDGNAYRLVPTAPVGTRSAAPVSSGKGATRRRTGT